MKVEIITIGDEILIGQVVDTNSAWMGKELNFLGADVIKITTVSDKFAEIKEAFDESLKRADVVIVTGGTGPTKDDVTKNVLLEYFGGKLVFNEDIKNNIEQIFANRNIKLNELTLSQAWVPDNAQILMNKVGTAPGTWFERNGKILISIAGVPSEMKWLMTNYILPRLEEMINKTSFAIHKTFLVKNYSESALAEKLEDFESKLPEYIKLAYLPQAGIVRLRLTGRDKDEIKLQNFMNELSVNLRSILGKDIYSENDLPIENLVFEKLLSLGLSLSTAESCTGGNIAHKLTLIPGSSKVFTGTVVAYDNSVKSKLLNVKEDTLEEFGAVSQEVVSQMLKGAANLFNTECVVATSGIAGPDGGTIDRKSVV